MENKRVLSFQSHVVSGYVGNKVAAFPLQLLGYDVDQIHSVQLSNHTGYPVCKGTVFDGTHVSELIDGLEKNHLLNYSLLMTGYIGSESSLRAVKGLALKIKEVSRNAIYILDPVMGDNGQFYVSQSVIPIYKEELLSIADVVTPNQFEAETLVGFPIRSMSDVTAAFDYFHNKNVTAVIITSAELDFPEQSYRLYASWRSPCDDKTDMFMVDLEKLEGTFTGTGDLFASLICGHIGKSHAEFWLDLRIVCEKAVSTMNAVLTRTCQQMKLKVHNTGCPESDASVKELCIIQSKRDIEQPQMGLFTAKSLDSAR